jgi:hypothetical protein
MLEQDTGSEVTSLVIPLPAAYFMLTPEQISQQFIEPYLPTLVNDGFLWAGCARSGQGVTTQNEYGPA